MARAQQFDFLHNMRFHVTTVDPSGQPRFLRRSNINGSQAEAGFTTCGTPRVSTAVAEYREGHYIYTRKQPGIPAMDDIELTRGVALTDTDFFNWIRVVNEGTGEYRQDVLIQHFHRDTLPGGSADHSTSSESLNLAVPGRSYSVHNAFPNNVKIATDLDSNSSEISIASMGMSYESFEVTPFTPL